MSGWLLVHSPATGPLVWQGVAQALRARGITAYVPDLRPTLTTEPGWAQRQVDIAVSTVDGGPYVVVGHSAAGALIPAIGKRLGDVAAYLFVDAAMPRPGRSFAADLPELAQFVRDQSADGVWTRPWSQWWGDELDEAIADPELRAAFVADCMPLPLAMFEEPGPDGVPDDAPCGYLRFSPAYDLEEPRALGWTVVDRPGDHLDMMVDPAGVTQALLALVADLTATVPRMSEEPREFVPDRSKIDLSRDPTPGVPDHLAPDDAGDRPFIDLSRDPTPGRPNHAAPEDDEE